MLGESRSRPDNKDRSDKVLYNMEVRTPHASHICKEFCLEAADQNDPFGQLWAPPGVHFGTTQSPGAWVGVEWAEVEGGILDLWHMPPDIGVAATALATIASTI